MVEARKLTTSLEMLLWMAPSAAPKGKEFECKQDVLFYGLDKEALMRSFTNPFTYPFINRTGGGVCVEVRHRHYRPLRKLRTDLAIIHVIKRKCSLEHLMKRKYVTGLRLQ